MKSRHFQNAHEQQSNAIDHFHNEYRVCVAMNLDQMEFGCSMSCSPAMHRRRMSCWHFQSHT
jgi:hypothetical protein